MNLPGNAPYRKGDELALAIFAFVVAFWVLLVPELGWAIHEAGLPYPESLTLYEPVATIPPWAGQVPSLSFLAIAVVIARFPDRDVYSVLVRIRYPYNPLSYKEFKEILNWARVAPLHRIQDDAVNPINRGKALSRAVIGAPLPIGTSSLYASSFAAMSLMVLLWAPAFLVALIVDGFLLGWPSLYAASAVVLLLLVLYFFAFAYFWLLYLITRRGWDRNRTWQLPGALAVIVSFIGAVVG